MEPIENMNKLVKERLSMKCVVCKTRKPRLAFSAHTGIAQFDAPYVRNASWHANGSKN